MSETEAEMCDKEVQISSKVETVSKSCRVCGDKAYTYNFGVITCESCKAFFRRNAHKEDLKDECSDDCKMTKQTRSFCKSCRLRKSFDVGMNKELIWNNEEREKRKKKMEENRKKKMRFNETKLEMNAEEEKNSFQAAFVESIRKQMVELSSNEASCRQYRLKKEENSEIKVEKLQEKSPESSSADEPPSHNEQELCALVCGSNSQKSTGSIRLCTSEQSLPSIGTLIQSSPQNTEGNPKTHSFQSHGFDVGSPVENNQQKQEGFHQLASECRKPVVLQQTAIQNMEPMMSGKHANTFQNSRLECSSRNIHRSSEDTASHQLNWRAEAINETQTEASYARDFSASYSQSVSQHVLQKMDSELAGHMTQLLYASHMSFDKVIIEEIKEEPTLADSFNQLEGFIKKTVLFARNIPAFRTMSESDQLALVKGSFLDLMSVQFFHVYHPETKTFVVRHRLPENPNRIVVTRTKAGSSMSAIEQGNKLITSYEQVLKEFNVKARGDPSIALCLMAHILFVRRTEYHYSNTEYIQYHSDLYLRVLKNYIDVAYLDGDVTFHEVVCILPKISACSRIGEEALNQVPVDNLSSFTKDIFNR